MAAFENVDIMKDDRAVGVCGLPLFEFANEDIDKIIAGHRDDIAKMLIEKDIYQFFFPAPDSTILGLLDKGAYQKSLIPQSVNLLPQLGHPFGDTEIVGGTAGMQNILKRLQEMNLVVEGEMNLTLSEKGEAVRGKIKFKPREGVVSKLLNRMRLHLGINVG